LEIQQETPTATSAGSPHAAHHASSHAAQSSFDVLSSDTPLTSVILVGPPEVPTPVAGIVAALRIVEPLDGLTDDEYAWLASTGTELVGQDGAYIFSEGSPCDRLIFILAGEIQVRRRKSAPAIFIGRAGQMTGKLPFSRMKTYGGDGITVGDGWGLAIHESLFPAMLQAIPSMTQRCVSTLLDRVREVTRMEQQAEKLTSLGKLAANLAHELNNPASAAQRSATSLYAELRNYGNHKFRLGGLCLSGEQSQGYMDWIASARRRMEETGYPKAPAGNAIALADREDVILRWLDARAIPEPWTIAPALAETGLGPDILDELAAVLTPDILSVALATVASSLRAERMAETVVDSTLRIFELISAIKDYSYMDQAPIQDVDLADSIENTLVMLQSRLQNVTIERDYDPELPRISAYGSELNQVWTALIENALDAVDGPLDGIAQPRSLRLKTHLSGPFALIEIWDNGPGIEPALQSRIFEPFFTTKAPGRGLGLGLDTAQRVVSKHSGFLTVQSKAGATCFQVRLPLSQALAY
jgi:signal transduction histidine kinase